MRKINEIVTHVSGQLSDQRVGQEFSRWPRQILLEYLNLGLKEIAAYRPDAFTKSIEQMLVAGSRQIVDTVGTVEHVVVNNKTLLKTDINILRAFSAYANACPPPLNNINGKLYFNIRSIAIDSTEKGVFYVSPPIPNGLNIKAEINVTGEPPEYGTNNWFDEIDMLDKYINNLIDYMMARAYKRDSESLASESKSQRLFQLFYQSMGQKYKIDSAFNSGYYKGEVGSGDPRAVI